MLATASAKASTPALNKTCWLSWPDASVGFSVGFDPGLTVEAREPVSKTKFSPLKLKRK